MSAAFAHVPRTARGHFQLTFYAAVYRLINYMHRLGDSSGDELKRALQKYPFLGKYFEEMLPHLPDGISWEAALAWWEREISAWEADGDERLPLVALSAASALTFDSRIAFMLAGLVEEDSRFGTLFADLQLPLTARRPSLELIGRVLGEGQRDAPDAWAVCRPLLAAGLLETVNGDAPRSEWILRVPAVLWDIARGESRPHGAPWLEIRAADDAPGLEELIVPSDFLARVQQLPALLRAGTIQAVILRGMQGSERVGILGAVARDLGWGVAALDLSSRQDGEREQQVRHLGPLCSMAGLLPVVIYDLGPGETAELPVLSGYRGPLGVLMGFEGGLSGRALEHAVTLTVPSLRVDHRRQQWEQALGNHPVHDLDEVSERFQLPGGYIRQLGSMAIAQAGLDRRDTVVAGDIREASRALNRQVLDALAARLEAMGSWTELVVDDATARKLYELERRCRHRERLLDHLGPAFGSATNRGVRALFSGTSGTGKTLAARILAAELGMDLYRVDLGAVVNKYIGETEKNLHRVLSRAEELDVILLLDEGDSLLSNRTDVKSSNDRYANLETNYLLQRLETYQGIVVVTTNAGQYIDNAFQRRMDVVVTFVPPRPEERRQIWQLHLPREHAVDRGYLDEVAARCPLTGGQIRNAALHATLLAVDEGSGVVQTRHVAEAIQSEFRKAGALGPVSEEHRPANGHSSLDDFLGALVP